MSLYVCDLQLLMYVCLSIYTCGCLCVYDLIYPLISGDKVDPCHFQIGSQAAILVRTNPIELGWITVLISHWLSTIGHHILKLWSTILNSKLLLNQNHVRNPSTAQEFKYDINNILETEWKWKRVRVVNKAEDKICSIPSQPPALPIMEKMVHKLD